MSSQPQPQPIPPTPFIPQWKNLRIFVLGLAWCCMGGLGPAAYELWQQKKYEVFDWDHFRGSIAVGVGPAALAYWRKYRALVQPPPD